MASFSDLKQTLVRAYDTKYSSFYRAKYDSAGFSPMAIRSMRDWSRVPFLYKKEIQSVPYRDLVYVPEKDIDHIRTTSGTTGSAMVLFPAHIDRIKLLAGLESAMLEKTERSLSFMYPHHLIYNAVPLENVVGGDPSNLPLSAELAKAFQINTLRGITPQMLVLFIPHLERVGALTNIKRVYLTGDRKTPWQHSLFKEKLPHTTMYHRYSSAEASIAGLRCEHTWRAEHDTVGMHPLSSCVFWEIIDHITEMPLINPEDEGELALTTIDWTRMSAFPLVRYRTGDTARLLRHAPCLCGKNESLFKLTGRTTLDRIRLGNYEIKVEEVERVLRLFKSELAGEFELHVKERRQPGDARLPYIELLVKRSKSPLPRVFLEERIAEHLRVAASVSYADAVSLGTFLPLRCGELKKTTATASKVIRMFDDRTEA